jgi:hypothetical protein
MKQFWLVSALEYLMLILFVGIGLGLFVLFILSIIDLEHTKKEISRNLNFNRVISTFDLYAVFIVYSVMAWNVFALLSTNNLI